MDPAPMREMDFSDNSTEKMPAPGSNSIIIQAENVMLQAAQQARDEKRDPSRMLRVLAVLSAPVFDPKNPGRPPSPLDLRQEWHVLAQEVRQSNAPILLASLQPPTLDSLRSALSPRAGEQAVFPHILHFSGHAWREGLLLEDDVGQVHLATTSRILNDLKGITQPLDLVVLNGCESAADARSVAQALVNGGLARAVVGHESPVRDSQATAFAGRLYAELAGGFPLEEAVNRARMKVTTHEVIMLGDGALRFDMLSRGEPLIDRRRAAGNLPSQTGPFLGRGRDLVEISRSLSHPKVLMLLSGPPGIGKTSLILEAAVRNQWRFPGGVTYARGPRPGTTTAAEMLKDLAGGLGFAPPAGKEAEMLQMHAATNPTLCLLGGESAALLALRPPSQILEDLPSARHISLHQGLALKEAERYALFLARHKGLPLDESSAHLIASSVEGHPKLIDLIVAKAGRGDLEGLLEDVKKHRGDFADQINSVYGWSQDHLDDAGKDAWAALPLFSAGVAPEGPLEAAAGESGPMALRNAALADFDPENQVWQWHATVAEYASSHWPISPEERQSRLMALAPAWTGWLDRLPVREKSISRIENVHLNLKAMVKACTEGDCPDCHLFLEALKQELPLPDRTLILRELIAEVCEARLKGLQPDEKEERSRRLSDLGCALSALGRREDSLIPAQEATDIYRKLAQSNPAAFLPDLAGSLGSFGSILRSSKRYEEAARIFAEGVKSIAPLYRQLPGAFSALAQSLQRDYLQACQEADVEPDESLLINIKE